MEVDVNKEVVEHIHYYLGAIRNKVRLAILFLLEKNENISFSELHEKLVFTRYIISKSILAYRLGVLSGANLIENEYSRKQKKLTRYRLTPIGKKILEIVKKWKQEKQKRYLNIDSLFKTFKLKNDIRNLGKVFSCRLYRYYFP